MTDSFQFQFLTQVESDDARWFRATEGGLEQPVDVQLALVRGKPTVVALRVDNDREVTARGLRDIRMRRLAEELLAFVRATAADLALKDREIEALRAYRGPLSHDWTNEASAWLTMAESGAEGLELEQWLEGLADADTAQLESSVRTRGARSPTEEEYRAFARVYLEEEAAGAYGARGRVARRLHMDRATVYRWARVCRERGHLPTPQQGESQ